MKKILAESPEHKQRAPGVYEEMKHPRRESVWGILCISRIDTNMRNVRVKVPYASQRSAYQCNIFLVKMKSNKVFQMSKLEEGEAYKSQCEIIVRKN